MQLSVIILNYNVRYFLELCLISVCRALTDIDAEIIVIDNASTDTSCKMVEELFPNIKLIKNNMNVGFAKANNQAVKVAKGEWICILNPDTVLPENLFKNILKHAIDVKNLGALGCRLIDGSGNFLPESKRNIPTPKVSVRKLMGNSKYYYADHIPQHSIAQVDVLVGAFMFLKRSVYIKVGGFDEDYFMYAEDVDLSYNLLKDGNKNIYLGTETLLHFKGESTNKDAKYLHDFYTSMRIFYRKHFRSNMFYDLAVGASSRIIPLFMKKRLKKKVDTEKIIIISNKNELDRSFHFSLPKTIVKELPKIENNRTYIFDIRSNSFENILGWISKNSYVQNTNFRFFIPQSGFIVGSDSSNDQGELLIAKD